MKKCCVAGCANNSLALGLCNKHYQRLTVHGDPNIVIVRTRPKCSIEDCERPNFSSTYCIFHHARFKRHGDPLFVNPKCNRDGKYRQRHKLYQKEWRRKNWPQYRAYLASRKRRVRLATPKWAKKQLIRKFYLECPDGYHVDHIVPLNGKVVSGLHILANLRYLPALENMRKGNKLL